MVDCLLVPSFVLGREVSQLGQVFATLADERRATSAERRVDMKFPTRTELPLNWGLTILRAPSPPEGEGGGGGGALN